MLQQSLLNKIKQYLIRNRYSRNFRKLVQFLCCIVVFVTTYALILPAITMEQETFCGKEEHTHSELCQKPSQMKNLICTPEKLEIHVHFEDCYDEEGTLTCGQADYIVHRHDASCYDAFGQLVCILPERSAHIHGEDCYAPAETLPEVLHVHAETCNIQEKGELICLQEEREAHFHKELCYEAGDVLECLLTENHVHDASCYSPSLSCTLSTEPHMHQDNCYEVGDLCCGILEGHVHTDDCKQEELTCLRSEGGHQHTNGCWETVQVCENVDETHTHGDDCVRTDLVCGLTEEQHYHDGSCYSVSIHCDIPENHMHGQGCYEAVKVCGKEAGETHEHATECYGGAPQLQCQQPENHTHGSACFNQILICELPEDPGHIHEDPCYLWNSVLNCGLEEGQPEPTEPAEPVLVCMEPEAPVHVHDETCFEPVADNRVLVCEVEEEGHEHTDLCYGCPLEEHVHTLICYSDPEADVETSDIWEATFAHVSLSGHGPTDLVAIAESQLGYTESIRNYEVWEDNSIHGYTRYGDWYGSPYGDWCAMFVSFCLNYADVDGVPQHWGVRPWISELSARGLYYSAKETKPQKGNLIFFDWERDGLADHVGIVADVQEAQEHTGASVKAIEGNSSDCVRYVYYSPDDPVILGYGLLPGQERIPVTIIQPDNIPDSLQAILICGMPAHTHGEICYLANGTCVCMLEEHIHKIDCIDSSIPVGFADGGSTMRMLSVPKTEGNMQYHTNLAPLFKSVEIYDSNNKLVYSSSDPTGGSGTVTIGENCLINVTFAEDQFNQFSTDGNLYYNIPANLSAVLVGSGVIRNRDNDIIATYTINNNEMVFTPVLVNGQNFFGAYNNVSMGINFNAEVIHSEGSTQTNIDFNGNFKVTVNVNEDAKIDAQKQAGEYDPNTRTITYQCKVSSYGGTIPLTYISDWWWPKNTADLVQNSIELKDKDGNTLDLNNWTLQSNEDEFKLTPKTPVTLAHGEFITLSYKVKVRDNIIDNYDLNNSFFAISNQEGKQLQDTDTATSPVTVTNVEKTGVHETLEGTNTEVLKWTVNIDNENLDIITITDQLGDNQQFYTDIPISVKATKLDGTEVEITIPWNNVQVKDDDSFTVTLPSETSADGKNVYKKYKIVYYSSFDLDEGNAGLQVFKNTVTTDVTIGGKPTIGTGSIGVVGIPPGIDKTAQSDAEWITFTITCRMPGGLNNQPNVLVYDSLSAWVNETGYYFQQNPDSMHITIQPDGGTAYELVPYTNQDSTDNTYLLVNDGQDFTIYFNTDQPSAATSVWKCAVDSTMTISYRVSRNAPLLDGWGGNPTSETLQDYLDKVHPGITNYAKLDYAPGYSVEDSIYYTPPPKPKPPLTKTAKVATVNGVEQDGVYDYSVSIDTTSGIFSTKVDDWHYDISSLIFTDTFDSRMEYVPGSFKVKAWSVWNVYEECVFLESKAPQITESTNTTTMVVNASNLKATKTYMAGQSLVNLIQEFTNGKFEFSYQLKVKDAVKQSTTEGVLLLDNTASIEWEDRFGTQTVNPAHNQVEYDTGVLQKGMHIVDDSNVVEFSILVNHNGLDLAADGDSYVLYDTMSSNLILLYDTLKVEIVRKAPDKNSVLSLTECKFEYDVDRNRMTFVLPDNEVIRLTYRCRVDGLGGTSTDVSNHVELLGRSTIQDIVESKFQIKNHEGSADADSEAFYLRKQDGNNHKILAGVTFNLYGDVNPEGNNENPDFVIDHTAHSHNMYLLGSFTTGEDGVVHIAHTQLTKKHLYALEEVVPPNGYVALSERYLFYVEERENDALQEIPCIIHNQLVVIENFPMGYELPATGGVGREVYAVGGWLLILAAGILLYNQKKCRKEDYQSS